MRRLALFARPPLPGRAKTRLSPALPAAHAAALAAAMLRDATAALGACRADERSVWWAERPAAGSPALAPGLDSHEQSGADLGERLAGAFTTLLDGPGTQALVAGSDTPALTAGHLERALALLAAHDVVLGPAMDGGYWCVGLSRPVPGLFEQVPWSTAEVLRVTLERARGRGLAVGLADPLDDVDTPADLARLVGALAAERSACGPALRAELGRLGLVPKWAGSAAVRT